MATEAQIVANRRNAQRSTGPRTSEGKARASRNALKHGLRARTLSEPDFAIVGESPEEFAGLLDALVADFAPATAVEEVLVETVAVSIWRLRRALRVENGEIAFRYEHALGHDATIAALCSLPNDDRLNAIVRYEAHVQRQLDSALRQLAALRRARELDSAPRNRAQPAATRLNGPDSLTPPRHLSDPATFDARPNGDRPVPRSSPGCDDRTGPSPHPVDRAAVVDPAQQPDAALRVFPGPEPAERTHSALRPPDDRNPAHIPASPPAERTQSTPVPSEPARGHPSCAAGPTSRHSPAPPAPPIPPLQLRSERV